MLVMDENRDFTFFDMVVGVCLAILVILTWILTALLND